MVATKEGDSARWQALSSWLVALDPKDLTVTVLEDAVYAVLDWLGCAMAGSQRSPDLVQFLDSHGPAAAASEATVVGRSERAVILQAVEANETLGRAENLHDILEPGGVEVGAAVIPVAFALAEKLSRSGPELLAAVVAGYEAAAYLSPTRTIPDGSLDAAEKVAACAAAAAAAKLMKLDVGATARALAMVWARSVVRPASSVALAACLEAESAYKRWTTEMPPILPRPDSTGRWRGGALRCRRVRLHASASHTWSAIDAMLTLKSAYRLHPEDLEAIEVHTSARAATDGANTAPETDAELRQSIPYCLAMVLLRGQVLPTDLSAQLLLKAPMGWVMTNTAVKEDPRYTSAHSARVIVRTRYGHAVEHTIVHPRGSLENPASPAEVLAKFKALVASALSPNAADRLARQVLSLSRLPDVRILFADHDFDVGNPNRHRPNVSSSSSAQS